MMSLYVTILWKHFSRDIAFEERELPLNTLVPMNSLFVVVAIGWWGFSSRMLIVSCSAWFG